MGLTGNIVILGASQGPAGPRGLQGEKGDKGDPGAQGPAGTDGASVSFGTTAGTAAEGNDSRFSDNAEAAASAQTAANAALIQVSSNPTLNLPPFMGTVIPVFYTANSFDGADNSFVVAEGGGLIAETEGTTSSGYRRLPREANTSRVTRTDWLVSWDPTDTTGTMTLGIGLASGKYNVTLSNSAS